MGRRQLLVIVAWVLAACAADVAVPAVPPSPAAVSPLADAAHTPEQAEDFAGAPPSAGGPGTPSAPGSPQPADDSSARPAGSTPSTIAIVTSGQVRSV